MVVLDFDIQYNYDDKISPAYVQITTDPQTYLEKKINIKESPMVEETKQLIPRAEFPRCPKLNELPEIRKEETPLLWNRLSTQ